MASFLRKLRQMFSDDEEAPLLEGRARLTTIQAQLSGLRLEGALHGSLLPPLNELVRLCAAILDAFPAGSPNNSSPDENLPDDVMLDELESFTGKLQQTHETALRRGKPSWDNNVDRLFADLEKLNAKLAAWLEKTSTFAQRQSSRPVGELATQSDSLRGLLPKTAKLRTLAEELEPKKYRLPEGMRPSLASISGTALRIVDRLENEPELAENGLRFLTRYLEAVHSIAGQLDSMRAQSVSEEQAKRLEERSSDLLQRLNAAFLAEEQGLSKGKLNRLAAELAVLDTLLKTEGH